MKQNDSLSYVGSSSDSTADDSNNNNITATAADNDDNDDNDDNVTSVKTMSEITDKDATDVDDGDSANTIDTDGVAVAKSNTSFLTLFLRGFVHLLDYFDLLLNIDDGDVSRELPASAVLFLIVNLLI